MSHRSDLQLPHNVLRDNPRYRATSFDQSWCRKGLGHSRCKKTLHPAKTAPEGTVSMLRWWSQRGTRSPQCTFQCMPCWRVLGWRRKIPQDTPCSRPPLDY